MTPTITRRELNRATLARQLLLERAELDVVAAVDALAGLQAQEPRPPYLGLWTRLRDVSVEDVGAALAERRLVRAPLMRGTLHVVSAAQFGVLRPALAPMLAATLQGRRARTAGVDGDAVVVAARAFLADGPQDFDAIRAHLSARFPDADHRILGYAARMLVPLAMVPSADRWGFPRSSQFALADHWLGAPVADAAPAAAVVGPYLAAFGPASAADVQAWSGLGGLRAVLDAMRDELIVLRDERGRELFDLPDAPRPGADVPAPPRLLPEFDNLVLAHDDRTRLLADAHRGAVVTKNLRVRATFLVDGEVAGTWALARKGRRAVVTLAPFGRVAKAARPALEEEAQRLAAWAEPDAASVEVAVSDASP